MLLVIAVAVFTSISRTASTADSDVAKDDVVSLAKGTLSGKVVGPDGKPVINARIWVNTFGKLLAETRSNASGRFRLGPLEPVYRHPFPILIDADGFARQYVRRDSYSVFPGADTDLGEIRLDIGQSFKGQVLDFDGTPCGGASVECASTRYELGHTVEYIGPSYKLTTDSTGNYQTPALPVGDLDAYVRKAGRQLGYVGGRVSPSGTQTLETVRMERDIPIDGVLVSADGEPVAGAKIRANYERAVSDSNGKFTLHGFGAKPRFQFQVFKDGFAVIDWGLRIEDDGIRWYEVKDENNVEHGPIKKLSVTMQREAWIEGLATDADTGKPVRLDKIVRCNFERKPNGQTVLNGCWSAAFQQPEDGHFRVPYSRPDEYHLTFSARGYHDAEAYTPKVSQLQPISGINVKLRKKAEGTTASLPEQSLTGIVTRNGKPVKSGWAALCVMPRQYDRVSPHMFRGRTVIGDLAVYGNAAIRDGRYSLDVRFQDDEWYVVAEEPGQPPTVVGPIAIKLNEKKRLDIECVEAGSIQGRVKNVPAGWAGNLWAVAFSKKAIQAEARVNERGEFRFVKLPPGDYGLKVGHDGFHDPDVLRDANGHKELWELKPEPWKRATLVTVKSGIENDGVELELPDEAK